MRRERVLQVAMAAIGLLFLAAVLPMIGGLQDPTLSDTGDTMMMSLYATLGVFLLIAVRNPSAHRSLIIFAAWSCFAHAFAMSALGFELPSNRDGFVGSSVLLVVIGVVLLLLRPRTSSDPGRHLASDDATSNTVSTSAGLM